MTKNFYEVLTSVDLLLYGSTALLLLCSFDIPYKLDKSD